MSDRLARIEGQARERRDAVFAYGGDSETADWAAMSLSTKNVLALVEIARAAQTLRYAPGSGIDDDVLVAREDFYALRAALDRLDTSQGQP